MDVSGLATLAGGHAQARAIQVAVKLGLFEALASGKLDQQSLAGKIGCQPRATGLLANALVALGLLGGNSAGYTLSEPARRFLLKSSGEYLGAMILFDEALFSLWSKLESSVRSGRPARTPDRFQARPEETELFIAAMDGLVRARGDASYLAGKLELDAVSTIADIGGGPGTYMVEFLRRWPGLRATVYDLPATLKVTRRLLAASEPGVRKRIRLVELNYLTDEIPGPHDALFLSNIIHSETAEANEELMLKCLGALRPGGLIIIKDHIMNHDLTEPAAGAVFSLYLLLTTHGRDYSFDEVSGWLKRAGFAEIGLRALPTPPFTSSLVLARRPR